jgi:hypothetical protein
MDEFSTTSDSLNQANEDILTPTVSDDALEASARGRCESRGFTIIFPNCW